MSLKFIQIADLIGGLPGFLVNEQANSTLSHMSLKSEVQSIKEKIYSTEMVFSAFGQKGKVLQSMERLRKKTLNGREVANMSCMVRAADLSS